MKPISRASPAICCWKLSHESSFLLGRLPGLRHAARRVRRHHPGHPARWLAHRLGRGRALHAGGQLPGLGGQQRAGPGRQRAHPRADQRHRQGAQRRAGAPGGQRPEHAAQGAGGWWLRPALRVPGRQQQRRGAQPGWPAGAPRAVLQQRQRRDAGQAARGAVLGQRQHRPRPASGDARWRPCLVWRACPGQRRGAGRGRHRRLRPGDDRFADPAQGRVPGLRQLLRWRAELRGQHGAGPDHGPGDADQRRGQLQREAGVLPHPHARAG